MQYATASISEHVHHKRDQLIDFWCDINLQTICIDGYFFCVCGENAINEITLRSRFAYSTSIENLIHTVICHLYLNERKKEQLETRLSISIFVYTLNLICLHLQMWELFCLQQKFQFPI